MVGVAQFGRAPGCGPGGRGFKSHHSPHKKIKGHCNTAMAFVPFAPVAQLDRAPDFESVGRPFECYSLCTVTLFFRLRGTFFQMNDHSA